MGKFHAIIPLLVLAALATSQCVADEPFDTAPIVSALMEVTKDADANVRQAAFDALKTQPRSDEVLELFWRGLEDEHLQIRTLSLDKLIELEGPTEKVLERLVLLANQVESGNDRALARQARSRLISIGAPALPYLIDSLKKDETNYYAISALGSIRPGEHRGTVTTLLTAMLKSEETNVRFSAVQALQSIMRADASAKAEAEAAAQSKARHDERYLLFFEKMLQKYDSDGNGSLTKKEWSKMSKDPAAADTDEDGKITAAELAKWATKR